MKFYNVLSYNLVSHLLTSCIPSLSDPYLVGPFPPHIGKLASIMKYNL
jgi:hypothetical protein